MMGKRLIYAKITCVVGLSCCLSPQTLFAVKASGLLYILRTKFRYWSAKVRRQSPVGSMAMFTSAPGLLQTDLPDQNFIMYVLFGVLLPIYHKTAAR